MSEQNKKGITETIKMAEGQNGKLDRKLLFELMEIELNHAEIRGAVKLLHAIIFKSTSGIIAGFIDSKDLGGSKKEKDLYEVSGYLGHSLVKLLSCVDQLDRVELIKYIIKSMADQKYITKFSKTKR